jgi:hypothetical protein
LPDGGEKELDFLLFADILPPLRFVILQGSAAIRKPVGDADYSVDLVLEVDVPIEVRWPRARSLLLLDANHLPERTRSVRRQKYRDILRAQLAEVESAMAVGELLVVRQRSLVSEIRRDCHDIDGAEMVLAALEKSQGANRNL